MDWKNDYKSKLTTFEGVAKQVKDGDTVSMGFGVCGPSEGMFDAILDRWEELHKVRIIDGFQLRPLRLYDVEFMKQVDGHIYYCPVFAGAKVRQMYRDKMTDFFGASAWLLGSKLAHNSDIFIHMCTPPNKHGYVNMGVAGFYSIEAIKTGKTVGHLRMAVGEVNENMPTVLGDNWIHVSQFDAFVEHKSEIIKFTRATPGERDKIIGHYISELIQDRCTLQMGIGSIPEAVIANLEGKHDIGIVSEMFPMGLKALHEKGIVTNKYKHWMPGVTICSFCQGDQELYDFITENPETQIYPASVTNNPALISQYQNMTTVNMCLMMDLTGQIASEGMGHRMVSGPGGQLDFHFGAWLAPGGMPITVLSAARTLKDGSLSSSILPELPPGTPVTVTRALADNVVTEFGVATKLRNKSLRERAAALIEIAHPDLRGELRAAMKKNFYPKWGSKLLDE